MRLRAGEGESLAPLRPKAKGAAYLIVEMRNCYELIGGVSPFERRVGTQFGHQFLVVPQMWRKLTIVKIGGRMRR